MSSDFIWSYKCLVPMGGLEPPWTTSTTPSRWRVYQFHHIGCFFVWLSTYGKSGRSAGGASLTVSVIAVLVILSTPSVLPEK
jgi:hypothetical protein